MSNPKRTREEIRQAIKRTKMTKEQTPLTVEEFIEQQNLKLKSPMEGYVIPFSQLKSMLEQHTQAKVLEALEMAKEYCDEFAIKKIETEIKPKYEKKNS